VDPNDFAQALKLSRKHPAIEKEFLASSTCKSVFSSPEAISEALNTGNSQMLNLILAHHVRAEIVAWEFCVGVEPNKGKNFF
jgi:hypothetical protein